MEIKKISLKSLKPLEDNVRVHTQTQIQELIHSVEQFGQTRAIVVDENNNILIGNGLYEALSELGYEKAECVIKSGLSEAEKKKLILSDNRVFELGMDDFGNIEKYIREITASGDFDIAGYDEDSLKMIAYTQEDVEQAVQEYGTVETPPFNSEQNTRIFQEEPANQPQEETVEVKRQVLCPHCGEVIYLD